MGRIWGRHGLWREVCHLKCLGIGHVDRRICFLLVCDLSEDRGSIVSGFDASSWLPVLSLTWLERLDMLQGIELALDRWAL